jgi:hypothetical protein
MGTEIADAGAGKLTTFEPSPSFLETISYFQRVDPAGENASRSGETRMIDNAPQLARELDETMAVCILSIAGREVSQRTERKQDERPDLPDWSMIPKSGCRFSDKIMLKQ